jgi:hypothetical protein
MFMTLGDCGLPIGILQDPRRCRPRCLRLHQGTEAHSITGQSPWRVRDWVLSRHAATLIHHFSSMSVLAPSQTRSGGGPWTKLDYSRASTSEKEDRLKVIRKAKVGPTISCFATPPPARACTSVRRIHTRA